MRTIVAPVIPLKNRTALLSRREIQSIIGGHQGKIFQKACPHHIFGLFPVQKTKQLNHSFARTSFSVLWNAPKMKMAD